eukprot:TRINITY_DN5091_c0_g1_i2.p3 TRINITY_DN5091_c0_g1~~TRINITY_DN5091_c0_g1_i2.p3  ORF type:complete len:109 (-),score=0.35 TRINITY_DN5091_c0_g1_i2:292-618(-)
MCIRDSINAEYMGPGTSTSRGSGNIGFRFVWQARPPHICLICTFCSSGPDFAADFFQIPPHDGHPCLTLTVPIAKSVTDFYRRIIAHAEHTKRLPLRRAGKRFNYFEK